MRVGVTGASGFIGRALVPALLHDGHQVSVLVRDTQAVLQFSWAGSVAITRGDLDDTVALQAFAHGCDAVIHLAALAHISGTSAAQHESASAGGTANLLDAMQLESVPSLVYISSIKASSGGHASHYAKAKAKAESLVRERAAAGLQAIVLRPAIVFAPGMKGSLATWICRLQRGWMPRLPARTASLRMISRRDLCRAIVSALDMTSTKVPVFEVNDGRRYSLHKLELALRHSLRKPLPLLVLPAFAWWLAARASEWLFALTGKATGLTLQTWQTLFREDKQTAERFPGLDPCESLESALPGIISALSRQERL